MKLKELGGLNNIGLAPVGRMGRLGRMGRIGQAPPAPGAKTSTASSGEWTPDQPFPEMATTANDQAAAAAPASGSKPVTAAPTTAASLPKASSPTEQRMLAARAGLVQGATGAAKPVTMARTVPVAISSRLMTQQTIAARAAADPYGLINTSGGAGAASDDYARWVAEQERAANSTSTANGTTTVSESTADAAPPAPPAPVIQPQASHDSGSSSGGGSTGTSSGGGGGYVDSGYSVPPSASDPTIVLTPDSPTQKEVDIVTGVAPGAKTEAKAAGSSASAASSTFSDVVKYGGGILAALGLGYVIKKKFMGDRT